MGKPWNTLYFCLSVTGIGCRLPNGCYESPASSIDKLLLKLWSMAPSILCKVPVVRRHMHKQYIKQW